MQTTNLDAYLGRIQFSGERSATPATLRQLHLRHTESIPFENLSPLLGEAVLLDTDALFRKLVYGGRGGYCYEHNLLFQQVLTALGFASRGLAARVRWNMPDDVITARTHMLLLVTIDGNPWIADTGFGGMTLTTPLRLETGIEQATSHEAFRLMPCGHGYRMEARVNERWKALYDFDLSEQHLADYRIASGYLSRHPDSIFVQSLMAARPEAGRRHSLRDNRYSMHGLDGATEEKILSAAELRHVLEQVFHIRLPQTPSLEQRLDLFCQ